MGSKPIILAQGETDPKPGIVMYPIILPSPTKWDPLGGYVAIFWV